MTTETEFKVIQLDINNPQQRNEMQQLFQEYSASSTAEIRSDIVEKLCELPYFSGFMAYHGDTPAGFAVCFESFSSYRCKKVLNIHDFMVSARYRGRGFGKTLLKQVEAFAKENDILKITLEVDQDNHNAKKLYAACGFEDHTVVLKGLLHWQKYLSN